MSSELYLTFLLLSLGLIVIPGLNVMLIVANSVSHGRRSGLLTVMGTTSAMIIQLCIVIFGVASLLFILADWLHVLKWVGACYLVYLGIRKLVADRSCHQQPALVQHASLSAFWQGFLVSLANPKTLLFFAAYLPQFVNPDQPSLPQLALLATTFVLMALVFDSLYALLAARFQRRLMARSARGRDHLSGWLLITAGVVLGMTESRNR